jgi:hypothetical protein
MSHTRCHFCQRLPAAKRRSAGRSARCPLCHEEIIVARHSGESYRLASPEEMATARRRGRRLAAVGAAAGCVLLVGAAVAVFVNQPDPLRPPQNPTAQAGKSGSQSLANPAFTRVLPQRTRRQPSGTSVADDPIPTANEPGLAKPTYAPEQGVALSKNAPVQQVEADPEPPLPPVAARKPVPTPPWSQAPLTQESESTQLLGVTEVALDDVGADKTAKDAATRIKLRAMGIAKQLKEDPDAFVKGLRAERADLAGLPWRQGEACRLDQDQAKTLQQMSVVIRDALDASLPSAATQGTAVKSIKAHPDDQARYPDKFWQSLNKKSKSVTGSPALIPALGQMVSADNLEMRLALVYYLSQRAEAEATAALARQAVFDVHPLVRQQAVEGLWGRPAPEVVPHLVAALRYPWPVAARHAAEAIAALGLAEAVPDLVNVLAEPDPGAPFVETVRGQPVLVVRELVRVNHLRNCLLCHAPATTSKDPVPGPVPTPGTPLPRSFRVYYSGGGDATLVRADVTYLKQDFSVQLPVDNHGAWPVYQRFDFLVRTRPATRLERVAYSQQTQAIEPSLHKEAVRYALGALTGQDRGTSAQAWRDLMPAVGPPRRPAAEER